MPTSLNENERSATFTSYQTWQHTTTNNPRLQNRTISYDKDITLKIGTLRLHVHLCCNLHLEIKASKSEDEEQLNIQNSTTEVLFYNPSNRLINHDPTSILTGEINQSLTACIPSLSLQQTHTLQLKDNITRLRQQIGQLMDFLSTVYKNINKQRQGCSASTSTARIVEESTKKQIQQPTLRKSQKLQLIHWKS